MTASTLSPWSPARTALLGFLVLLGTAAPLYAQPFTYSFVEQPIQPLSFGIPSWADVDADGDLDVVLTGVESFRTDPVPRMQVLYNAGSGIRVTPDTSRVPTTEYVSESLPGAGQWLSAPAWSDYDGDGDLDLLVAGAEDSGAPYVPGTHLYRNEAGQLTEADVTLEGTYGGSAAWLDYDGDGDPDLLMTGATAPGTHVTYLYRNDGADRFTRVPTELPGIAFGDLAVADYDLDGDPDVVLSGVSDDGPFITQLFENAAGTFVAAQTLAGTAYGSLDWGDYDGDGDPDLLVTGGRLGPLVLEGSTELYRNTSGAFAPAGVDLPGVIYGAGRWGDYDNDGDLDLYLTGATNAVEQERLGRVYQNQAGQLTHTINLAATFPNRLVLGDYDADLDLDVLMTGLTGTGDPLVNQYQNQQRILNTRPEAPTGLQSSTSQGVTTLTWEAGADRETTEGTLTYEVRIGTAPGAADISGTVADLETGRRLVATPGRDGQSRRRVLMGLQPGTYHWSVQAVDASFVGSPFAAEGTFSVGSTANQGSPGDVSGDLPEAFALRAAYPNPFRAETRLAYDLPERAAVELTVYDVLGQVVRVLDAGEQAAGRKEMVWDGRSASGQRLGAGLYLVRLRAGAHVETTTVTLVH